jgi:spore germination protein KC
VRMNTSVFKRAFCLMLAAFGLILAACGDKTEIADLNIVVGFGIDQDGKNVRVTAQVRNAVVGAKATGSMGQQGGEGRDYVNHSASGRTVEEAVQNLRTIIPRRLYFAHNTVVVFGRQFAVRGIDPALDYLIRSREFRRTQLFCVTSGAARDVLTADVGAEQVNALGLQRLLLPEDIEFTVVKSMEMVFLNDLLSPSHVPHMTWVDVERGQAILKGVGLFRGDKLAELLPNHLAQPLLLLQGETNTFSVELPCKQPNQKSIIRVRFIKRELHPVQKGGNMSVHVRIRGSGDPVSICRGDFLETETIEKMEKDVNRELQLRLQKTVDFLQERRLDGVKWGTEIYRFDPQWWRAHAREWPQLFARMPVKIDSQVDVNRPGMYTTTPEIHYTPELYPPKSVPGGDRP